MHYLIYGKNTYAVKQKADAVKEKFLATPNADFNFSEFRGADFDYRKFISEASATPFLARKRLVFIHNFLLENKDDDSKQNLIKGLDRIPETTIIFFLEMGEPDKRNALFKFLNKPKIAQLFELPEPGPYSRWIDRFCQEQGYTIREEARRQLVLNIGIDLWRAENELLKLFLYAESQKRREITLADVNLLVTADIGSDIFGFTEALISKNEAKSFELLTQLLESGQNELYILTMMVYQFRTMLIVSELSSRGLNNSAIASQGKIHPFVVSKVRASLGKNASQSSLEKVFTYLAKVDYAIKSGESDARMALNLAVASICR